MARIAVIDFPGPTSTTACLELLAQAGVESFKVDHSQEQLEECSGVLIPGGYSYSDYLRPGSLAKVSPICGAIRRAAEDGKKVLGVGNGFQILSELRLLPGALLANLNGSIVNQYVYIKTANDLFTDEGQVELLPICCYFGRFVVDPKTLKELQSNNQIVARYCDSDGDIAKQPFNGSADSIAGICNRKRNVAGLMPRLDRAFETFHRSQVGKSWVKRFFK